MEERAKLKELIDRIDEVLYYKWDPIGVSDEPCARGEYSPYALSLLHSIISENKQEIVEKLSKIESELMGLTANHSKNEIIADRLILDKHAIEEGLR
jgi:hypothetical protein